MSEHAGVAADGSAQPWDGEELTVAERLAWQRWGLTGWQWREWLRTSDRAISLFDWCVDAFKYQVLVGPDGYRDRMLRLLAGSVLNDCAAAGMTVDGHVARWGADPGVVVHHSPQQEHRAVFWHEAERPASAAWVDGLAIIDPNGDPVVTADPGSWAGDRFLGVAVRGPQEHPAQDFFGFDAALGHIRSVLIWDAEKGAVHSLQEPGPDQRWTEPWIELGGDGIAVHADREDPARPPDRVVPID